MWSELFLCNAEPLAQEIDEVIKHLDEYRKAIRAGDREELTILLRDGRERKERLVNQKFETIRKGTMPVCVVPFLLRGFGKLLRKQVAERKFLRIPPKSCVCPRNPFT